MKYSWSETQPDQEQQDSTAQHDGVSALGSAMIPSCWSFDYPSPPAVPITLWWLKLDRLDAA
jgi:hypothetical protein